MIDLRVALGELAVAYGERLPDRPPGLMGDDVVLYDLWRVAPRPRPQVAWFNVRVGPSLEALTSAADPDAALAAQLGAPRVDLVVHDGTGWWIVEFHAHAGLPQLGRLGCYPELLRRTFAVDAVLRPLMVAHTVNVFVLPCFSERRIPVLLYPDRGSQGVFADPALAF